MMNPDNMLLLRRFFCLRWILLLQLSSLSVSSAADLHLSGRLPPSPAPTPITPPPMPSAAPSNNVYAPTPAVNDNSWFVWNPPPPPALDRRPDDFEDSLTSPPGLSSENDFDFITWCVVRDEIEDCSGLVKLLPSVRGYSWTCIAKQNAFDCMEAIKMEEADLVALDAGLAYVAFTNYQMKAIMTEEHCSQSKSYDAVAIVNKGMCEENPHLSLKDFRGLKSCHLGYLTGAGWDSPIDFLIESGLQRPPTALANDQGYDEAVVADFFSSTCAPSELEGRGLCTSCGNNNGSCTADSFIYAGSAGAFRCLVDGTGDIAFVRSDTAERLSSDGKQRQEWSTKPVDEFRYLCPQGGCRAINENVANCTFGTISANLIMTRNSQPDERRVEIVEALLNASRSGSLYNAQNWDDRILSSSAQNLLEIKDLTRHVLGDSAILAQKIQAIQRNVTKTNTTLYTNGAGASKSATNLWIPVALIAFFNYCLPHCRG